MLIDKANNSGIVAMIKIKEAYVQFNSTILFQAHLVRKQNKASFLKIARNIFYYIEDYQYIYKEYKLTTNRCKTLL